MDSDPAMRDGMTGGDASGLREYAGVGQERVRCFRPLKRAAQIGKRGGRKNLTYGTPSLLSFHATRSAGRT